MCLELSNCLIPGRNVKWKQMKLLIQLWINIRNRRPSSLTKLALSLIQRPFQNYNCLINCHLSSLCHKTDFRQYVIMSEEIIEISKPPADFYEFCTKLLTGKFKISHTNWLIVRSERLGTRHERGKLARKISNFFLCNLHRPCTNHRTDLVPLQSRPRPIYRILE